MVMVQTTTDEYPALGEYVALRQARGLDTYDEWWQGVYRIVTGPSPEHGELVSDLSELLGPLVRATGLKRGAPINIGLDRTDCRVPDLAIFEPDTPRTSPAFLTSALVVIEVLSPGEQSGEKLDFYQDHGVKEYLEIDLAAGTVGLWVWSEGNWKPETDSNVLVGLSISSDGHIVTPENRLVVAEYRPR
jgi:Uma2 family endonuclease